MPTKNAFVRSSEERLKEFREKMEEDLNSRLVVGVDSLETAIPEDAVEYIGDITEFIRNSEEKNQPEYGYMKR